MTISLNTRMTEAWLAAREQLGIRVTAPYEIEPVRFIAYLPDFGGQKGMVVETLVSTHGADVAAGAGLYLSRVSEDYAEFEADKFVAALNDWGWYGTADGRPAWYTGTAWTS